MKRIISFVVLISSIAFAQTEKTKSITELQQQSAVSNQLSAVRIKNQTSSPQNFSSVINNSVPIFQNPVPEKKNAGLAILYSMLLPGMGELYADSYDSGKYFTIADGVLWGVFAGYEIYGKQQENNYKSFAQSRGGINLEAKDADYFANIGTYQSIDDYNTAMELKRSFDKTYNPATHYWKWADNNQRKEYRDMWSSSESAYTNVRFVVGAMVLNRVISAINAVRLVSAYNKNLSQELSWNVYFNVENKPALPQTLTFNFISKF